MSKGIKLLAMTGAGLLVAATAAAFVGSRPSVSDCQPSVVASSLTAADDVAISDAATKTASYRVKSADGNCLQAYERRPASAPVRAAIVLVHGIHDHPGRYGGLVRALVDKGVAVYTHDHRGHGASGGARQRVDSAAQLVGDVQLVLEEAAKRNPGGPLFLYGHSMGGLVAAHIAAQDAARPRLAGVVLSSAALALPPSASGGARAVVGTLSRLAPNLPLEAIDPTQIVREAAARADLAKDPAILRDKVPARTIATILNGVLELQPLIPTITAPLLVLHGGADAVTPPQGSRALIDKVASKDKKLVIHGAALHSLLHEPEGQAVLAEIVAFVDARAKRP